MAISENYYFHLKDSTYSKYRCNSYEDRFIQFKQSMFIKLCYIFNKPYVADDSCEKKNLFSLKKAPFHK